MPVGRHLRIHLHPDDRPLIDRYVHRDLASVLLADRSTDRGKFEVGDSAHGISRLICPRSLLPAVNPHFLEARQEWALDVMSGPVIEWWFSKLEDGLLYPGRFYYVPPLPGALEPDQLAEFNRVAATLFRWVRAQAPTVPTEWGKERLGPVAARLFNEGAITLRVNPPGSLN